LDSRECLLNQSRSALNLSLLKTINFIKNSPSMGCKVSKVDRKQQLESPSMDRIPEKVLDNVLSNLSVMDLFRLQVVSKAFKESCRRSLKSRKKLIVRFELHDIEDRMYKYMDTVFLERLKACNLDDAIRPELFNYLSKAILNRMTGLKELYIMFDPLPKRVE